jgi:hypothetical protein
MTPRIVRFRIAQRNAFAELSRRPSSPLLLYKIVANFFLPQGVKLCVHSNFWRSLAAVVIGNLLYFACGRFLPPAARHNTAQFDLGLVVDFWFCLVVLGLLELWYHHKRAIRRSR